MLKIFKFGFHNIILKNKVRKYLENHFITESFFFFALFETLSLLILQNPKLPNLSVSIIFI